MFQAFPTHLIATTACVDVALGSEDEDNYSDEELMVYVKLRLKESLSCCFTLLNMDRISKGENQIPELFSPHK